ncbi:hypothetical protein [Aureivirga sp. CE67]|uniref:hypothetical protein n=1 Tax=Aureivirga sp. CE67 TaxID=1788983 RepID=UPI0018CA987C|nr:hypothetical protein [Aureivirga sp. CE67]
MMKIENKETLLKIMKTEDFYVEWIVTSDIGPDWIGSYRSFEFFIGQKEIEETPFIEKISKQMIDLIKIPETSEDHVIYGEAGFFLENEQLKLNYDWYAAIPYQNADFSKAGTITINL